MDRCRFVDEHGNRCTRAAHPEEVHVFGGPATIPPMWWTPQESTAFVAGWPMMIEHGVVAVEPATGQEAASLPFQFGRLHVAARRAIVAAEALLAFDDLEEAHQAHWTEWHDARSRVLAVTGNIVHRRFVRDGLATPVTACGVTYDVEHQTTEEWALTTCVQCIAAGTRL